MIFALLPVKAPTGAKQRLGGLLSAEERAELARLMFAHALAALLRAQGIDRVVVASSDAEVLWQAEAAGAATLPEAAQNGHSSSADWAARQCMQQGATTVLLAPIDVPLVTTEEFEALAKAAVVPPVPRLVIVPSRDGTGTNAMARTPPDLIESRFGLASFPAHVQQGRARGAAVEVLDLPGLTFDLDTPEDAAWFLAQQPRGPVADYLRSLNCASRLALCK